MKQKKAATKSSNEAKQLRKGTYTFDGGVFCGINKYGIYVGLKMNTGNDGETDTEFLSSYEAINFLNTLLNEFDSITVEFGESVSKNNKTYETCNAVDYKI